MSYRKLSREERIGLRILVRAAEEERDARVVEVPPELRWSYCEATTKRWTRCGNPAVEGSSFCVWHQDFRPEPEPDLTDRLLDRIDDDVVIELARYQGGRQ